MKLRKRKTEKNRGFSIVEFLVAFGILSVIITTVGYMMTTSSKTYSGLSTEAQLQSEAQLVANAISELAIDSFDAGNTTESDYTCQIDDSVSDKLVLLSKTRTESARYRIERGDQADPSDKNKLYLYTQTYDNDANAYTGAESKALLGQYIEGFDVKLDRVKDENMISFSLTYVKNGRSYVGDYQVLMRNRAYADPDAKDPQPEDPQLRALTLTPKLVFIDVINNKPVQYYKDTLSASPYTITTGNEKIDFTATPIYSGTPESTDSTWSLSKADTSIFSLSAETGPTTSLVMDPSQSFIDSSCTELDVVAAQQSLKKTAKVKLRIVKKIGVNSSSGITSWKSSYESALYGGSKAAEAEGYAQPNGTVIVIASIDQYNVNSALDWKLYYRSADGTGAWAECTDSSYAAIANAQTTRTTNTITLGSNATNSMEFKIEATSHFDPSVKGSYIFGVVPTKGSGGDGFHSRGFYVNMNDYFTKNVPALQGNGNRQYRVAKVLDMWFDPGSNYDVDPSKAFKWDKNSQCLYIDYDSFQYSSEQRATFYGSFEINIHLRYIDVDGVEREYGVYHYPVHGVEISPTGASTICIQKGKSSDLDVHTSYYNISKRDQFGIYVKEAGDTDFSGNLNREGQEATNKYLTPTVTSAYGDVNTYVDDMTVNIEAKTSTKDYPADYMVVRTTVDDFYNVSKHGNAKAYYDFKVYVANVEGQGVYIPGPNSRFGGWPSSVGTAAGTATEVSGIDTTGKTVKAKVYKDGSKYKCIYGSSTYTYNKTYNYWKK
mgnify:CR=1 FL=1